MGTACCCTIFHVFQEFFSSAYCETNVLMQGAISQGERRAASAMSAGSSYQFSSSPRTATKAARQVVRLIMQGIMQYPEELQLETQFGNTGLSADFRGDFSKFMNRVLGLTFEAQKFVLSRTVEQYRNFINDMRKKNEIDPETKRNFLT
jgi:hypothetical protein